MRACVRACESAFVRVRVCVCVRVCMCVSPGLIDLWCWLRAVAGQGGLEMKWKQSTDQPSVRQHCGDIICSRVGNHRTFL